PSRRARTPLAIEDRVDGLALPLAFEVLVLDEERLPAHPQLLQDAGRRRVPWFEPADHPVQTELIESDRKHRAPAFGRVAMPVVVRVDDVTELAARMLPAEELQGEITDHGARLLQLDREGQEVAFGDDDRRCDLLAESLTHLVLGPPV